MNILFLAPHPFFQERGTPIAVDLLLGALSRRGHRVDVVTFHEGADRAYPGVPLHRIPRLPGVRGIRPGFSLKKLLCDLLLLRVALRLAARGRYQVVHAVEEAVFVAMLLRRRHGIPYLYDMDSSLPRQMIEKHPWLAAAGPLMRAAERRAVRGALAVVPVCDALAEAIRPYGPRRVVVLRDVSLLAGAPGGAGAPPPAVAALTRPRFLYLGNLERYQGIDLLLDSFARLRQGGTPASLVVAGGTDAHVRRYTARARRLGLGAAACFLGPWPVARMADLVAAADVLVSPRLRGENTPMKIYSYLASGKPILATDLPTHTQVLARDTAVLAVPEPAAFAAAMRRLAENPAVGRALADRARALAVERYSPAVFERTVQALYEPIERAAQLGV